MIQKISKPKVRELRSAVLTNVGYKLMIAVVRYNLEEHIRINKVGKDTQGELTPGSRIESN